MRIWRIAPAGRIAIRLVGSDAVRQSPEQLSRGQAKAIAEGEIMSSVVTRRRTVIGFSALSAAIVLPSRARADQAVLAAAARQECTLTWYVAQQDTETAELFGRTFTALHPGVMVDVIRTTGQVAFQRLSLDIKNHTPHCDVFSATDIAHMPLLKEHSDLAQFTPDNSADMRPQFKAQSDAGWYYITNAGRWVLLRNSEKVSRDAAPKAWTDLLDPKWKGRVSVAHPAFTAVRVSGPWRCRNSTAGITSGPWLPTIRGSVVQHRTRSHC
jgi:iron(III) transport system substrate-binding protein